MKRKREVCSIGIIYMMSTLNGKCTKQAKEKALTNARAQTHQPYPHLHKKSTHSPAHCITPPHHHPHTHHGLMPPQGGRLQSLCPHCGSQTQSEYHGCQSEVKSSHVKYSILTTYTCVHTHQVNCSELQIHTHRHTHRHTHTHVHTHTCTYTHLQCTHTHIHTHTYNVHPSPPSPPTSQSRWSFPYSKLVRSDTVHSSLGTSSHLTGWKRVSLNALQETVKVFG